MLRLNTIKAQPGANKRNKRLGRGPGSGHGQTAGKGDKGQLARSGGSVKVGFEGGQTPLYRRLPKRGFTNVLRYTSVALNLVDLEKLDASLLSELTLKTLKDARVVKGRYERLVILGTGVLTKAVSVKAHRVSEGAKQAIEKAGGKIELIPTEIKSRSITNRKKGKAKK